MNLSGIFKQTYNLVRVRSYVGIRNMVVLMLAVSSFTAVYLGQNLKLKLLVERIFFVSKSIFGGPSFFNYAIADGLYNIKPVPVQTIIPNQKRQNEYE